MSVEDLIPFKPGQSGNPGGRPKGGKNRATIIKEILALRDAQGITNEQKMIQALYDKATSGDLGSIKEVQDTVYGKIPDKVLTAETDPVSLERDITDQALKLIPTEELEKLIEKADGI